MRISADKEHREEHFEQALLVQFRAEGAPPKKKTGAVTPQA
jgi:hypothetical protein